MSARNVKRFIAVVAIVPLLLGLGATAGWADPAVVTWPQPEEGNGGHVIHRDLPTDMCLRSHEEPYWEDPEDRPLWFEDWGPGPGGIGPNVGGQEYPGYVEFGLVTPGDRFTGQAHYPGTTCEDAFSE